MFANREWEDVGAVVINEQTVYKQPGNSHTSRHASVELLYGEKTGDHSSQDAVIRRLNWATYMVDDEGRNQYPATSAPTRATRGPGRELAHRRIWRLCAPLPSSHGQSAGARAGEPEPPFADVVGAAQHPLRSGHDRVREVRRGFARERFKLGEWIPRTVTGGRMQWDPKTRVLTVQSTAKTVTIRAK